MSIAYSWTAHTNGRQRTGKNPGWMIMEERNEMTVKEKLLKVQSKLNAPKNRQNRFGGYSYRSCEDILEAVKPLLAEVKAIIKLTDNIMMIGDRIYVNATAWFVDVETDEMISADAFAREPADKKGMDAAQITGTASSYARKYALNGLLLIDDAKDPDTDEYKIESDEKAKKAAPAKKKQEVDASVLDGFVNNAQLKTLEMLIGRAGVTAEKFCQIFSIDIMSELPAEKYDDAVSKLEVAIKTKEGK